MRSILIVLLLISSLQANAYVYRIDPSNKYHSEPPSNMVVVKPEATGLSKAAQAILKPVGQIVGGLVSGLAIGLENSVENL